MSIIRRGAVSLTMVLPDHPSRDAAEHCISSIYAHEYGAEVPAFPKRLVAVLDGRGEPLCAAGLRMQSAVGYLKWRARAAYA